MTVLPCYRRAATPPGAPRLKLPPLPHAWAVPHPSQSTIRSLVTQAAAATTMAGTLPQAISGAAGWVGLGGMTLPRHDDDRHTFKWPA